MLFLIFAGILALAIVTLRIINWSTSGGYYSEKSKVRQWVYDNLYEEWVEIIAWVVTVVMSIVILVAGLVVADARISNDVYREQYVQEYAVLTYELENVKYDNDNDLGKKELYTQIREYNTEVAGYKAQLENPWIGVFVAPCLADVPLIELGG